MTATVTAATKTSVGAVLSRVGLCVALASTTGCGKSAPKPAGPTMVNGELRWPALTTNDTLSFFKDNCTSCHGKGKPYYSFWAYDEDALSRDALAVDPMAPVVYQAIYNRYKNISDGDPSPMPVGKVLTDAEKPRFGGVISWFEENLPNIVAEAKQTYHYAGKPGEQVKINNTFKCDKPLNLRQFLVRFGTDAFDETPSPDDFQAFTDKFGGLDIPVTKEMRDFVGKRLAEDPAWQDKFRKVGLKKFAQKVAGAADIPSAVDSASNPPLNPQLAGDGLREEFYRLLVAKMDTTSWRDILLGDTVMVNVHTRKLYGSTCKLVKDASAPTREYFQPSEEKDSDFQSVPWRECDMQSPRGSFFTTVGFLQSKRTSMFELNNNYGRVATLQFTLSGEVFKAATNGPTGEKVKALPACLKTEDYRAQLAGTTYAPFGSAKIPASGNVCQSCHVSRHMASGSILFRPFGFTGALLRFDCADPTKPEAGVECLTDAHPKVVEAIADVNVIKTDNDPKGPTEKVEPLLLRRLLEINTDREQACLVGKAGQPDKVIRTVKQLAEHLVGDGNTLVKGLGRHMPRSLSNLQTTNQDIMAVLAEANKAGGGKLFPMFQAYFTSSSYACEKME